MSDPAPLTPATTDDIVDLIVKTVKEHSHKLITRDTARRVYEAILLKAIHETKQHGFFKLPYGYGQFMLRVIGLGARPRRLPDGTVAAREPRPVMRYFMGATTQALLEGKTPGAYKRRGPKSIKVLRNLKGFRNATPE